MTHRCTIQRRAGTDDDGGGGVSDASWQPHLTAQPCRYYFQTGQRITRPGEDVVAEQHRLVLPLAADVLDNDQVETITDRRGRQIAAGPFSIDTIGRLRDHQILYLSQVQ